METQLINAKELAKRLALSKRQVFRLHACGKIPAPVRIGGAVRWVALEIGAWLAAGAPDARAWESMKSAETRKGA
ncbi:MAG: helix-turn-helix transcriptional regulator [Acetivibrionales bacterium]|jgi:prophage regulatory protein